MRDIPTDMDPYDNGWDGDFDDDCDCGGVGCPNCMDCQGMFSPGTEECDFCEYYSECAGREGR